VRIDVCFTPAEIAGSELAGRTAVVVDVLRATSTIVEALANGARSVFPVATMEDALRLAQNLGRDTVVLCGERGCLPIPGFDLGNSPAEFTAERIGDHQLVMTTTNGTGALLAAAPAAEVWVGAFLNLGAVAAAVAGAERDVVVVAAGRERRFALEDALFAGALVRAVEAQGQRPELNDSAVAARLLATGNEGRLEQRFRMTAAGRQLMETGHEADLCLCADVDRHGVVPTFRDRKVTV
jgi:2-phosphosulfolactate phosphatase